MTNLGEPVVGRPNLVLPLAILAAGVLMALLVSRGLQFRRDEDLSRNLEAYAGATARLAESRVDDLYEALRRRAELWDALMRGDLVAWHRSADVFLHENPAVLGLVQTDPSLRRPQTAGSPDGQWVLDEVTPKARQGAEASAGLGFAIGPIRLEDGRSVFAVEQRIASEPHDKPRSLLAVYDPRLLLERGLEPADPDYALSVSANGMELYRRAEAAGAAGLERAAALKPSLGAPWTLTVWPTARAMAAHGRDQGPLVALVAGLMISVLAASIVHVGALARRRARALAVANDELREQVQDARRSEGELKRLSDELEARVGERTAALNETIVELETFNYSVSHDLRSPLGAISNFAAILGEDYREVLDSTAAEYLQRIVQSATVAASMMDGLLAYSSSGRQSLNKTRVAMKRLVEEVATEVAAAWPQLECKMEIGNLPEAYADEGMMRFVWSNLISNACKFARPDQPPRVEISGQASDVEVTYCVRDHGMGFDMRYADRLFKVFERLHSADRQQGHGVGLAIVARMVRRHGGRVWAQGAEGKGATFYFSLPAGQERDEDGGRRT